MDRATCHFSNFISYFYIRSELRINFSFQLNKGGRDDGDIHDCKNLVQF
jgi:hypothetical protein